LTGEEKDKIKVKAKEKREHFEKENLG